MLDRGYRTLFLALTALGLFGSLQACGTEKAEEESTGFGSCVTADQGFSSCDEYCASTSRACVVCGCPGELKDSILCRDDKQYSAVGWKANAQCDGAITSAFNGCLQSVFRDSSGAVLTMSVKCCCE